MGRAAPRLIIDDRGRVLGTGGRGFRCLVRLATGAGRRMAELRATNCSARLRGRSDDRNVFGRLRGGADLRLGAPYGRGGTDQEVRLRLRSSTLPSRREGRAGNDVPRTDG